MKGKSPEEIDAIFADGKLIDEALKEGAREALRVHRQSGLPLVIWRDGKIEWVSPDEFASLMEEGN